MEINRRVLKKKAWNSLKGIYWFLFLACILAGLVGAGGWNGGALSLSLGGGNTSAVDSAESFDVFDYHFENVEEFFNALAVTERLRVIVLVIAAVLAVAALLVLLFRIFVSGPAEVCFARTKLEAVIGRNKDSDNFLYGFRCGYGRVLKVTFLKNLYIALWGLLPLAASPLMVLGIICFANGKYVAGVATMILMAVAMILLSLPALVKTYSYMLVPYIVAEAPQRGAREAITLSRKMMQGFKWQAFVLRLSFIGWYIVGALCCAIGVLFVEPYYQAAETLLYDELKAYYNTKNVPPEGEAVATELIE